MSSNRRSRADLLGEDEPETVHTPVNDPETVHEAVETDWAKIRNGVTINWLAGAFRLDRKTVKKRLGTLSPKQKKSTGDLYDLEQAASFLVKPQFDIKEYMKKMNPNELPPMLRKEYWEAENKRVSYEERAGELWPTDSVVAVFAEAFKLIKNQVQVWVDDIERDAGLTPEQYKSLTVRVDGLREELFKTLCEMPANYHHGSALEEGPIDGEEA